MTAPTELESFKKTPYYAWAIASLSPRELKTWNEELEAGGDGVDRHLALGKTSEGIASKLQVTDWASDTEALERIVNQTFAETDGESEDPGVEVSFG